MFFGFNLIWEQMYTLILSWVQLPLCLKSAIIFIICRYTVLVSNTKTVLSIMTLIDVVLRLMIAVQAYVLLRSWLCVLVKILYIHVILTNKKYALSYIQNSDNVFSYGSRCRQSAGKCSRYIPLSYICSYKQDFAFETF